MHEDLQRLTSELRQERCPQRVLDEVARRIAAQSTEVPAQKETKKTKDISVQPGHSSLPLLPSVKGILLSYPRFLTTAFVTAALLLVCSLAIWHRLSAREAQRHPDPSVVASLNRAQVVRETEGALGYIGCVLLDAGAHTEKIVLNQAVPRLRNSLTTTREKLLNHIQR
jgi:hypothetical protein